MLEREKTDMLKALSLNCIDCKHGLKYQLFSKNNGTVNCTAENNVTVNCTAQKNVTVNCTT